MSSIFVGALLFSIWSVILFVEKSVGLSMLLFVVPLSYFLIKILEKNKRVKFEKAKLLIIPITLLSSTYFIYNNKFFNNINIFVIPILVLIMVIDLIEKDLKIEDFIERITELIFNPIAYFQLTMQKFIEFIKIKLKMKNTSKKSNILKGILITIPIVILIIILLSSADEIFGGFFVDIFIHCLNVISNVKIAQIFLKILITILVFLYLSCFFDNLINRYESDEKALEEQKNKEFENTTIKMILVTLNIIYIVFCIIQIKSLFMKVNIENYAQYARKGFFQLMIVSVINLIVILIAKFNKNDKFINIMCLLMIACTFIILLSSAYRMRLYESTFGYTLLRLLVYVALFTESILLIPTVIYVLDKPIKLLKVYFLITLFVYVCINFANIDNIIARKNIDRYFATGKIDLEYLMDNTGTDAISQIIRIRESETETEEEENIKNRVVTYISNIYTELENEKLDFRNFNISKFTAKIVIF